MSRLGRLIQEVRKYKYKFISTNKRVTGKPKVNQPVLLAGRGEIRFGVNVELGYYPSPFFYSGYIHLESRTDDSIITIDEGVIINNNFFAISCGSGIHIGRNTLIGLNCEIIDSDFHEINPQNRKVGKPISKKVVIGENVFLGNNVKVAKGVVLGNNVVVGNGSVVLSSFEDNVIIGGMPAKVIGKV